MQLSKTNSHQVSSSITNAKHDSKGRKIIVLIVLENQIGKQINVLDRKTVTPQK